jgi:hypothetical protein
MVARRVALPESKLKRKKRIRRTRLAILLGVVFILLAGLIVGLSWIPYIRIHSIAVSGTETVSTSSVEQFAQQKIAGRKLFVFPEDNIFLYPKKEIKSGLLAANPQFKSADVHAENFETIGIDVAERHAAALWCGASAGESGECRLVDENGFAYAPDLSLVSPAFVRYTGEATTTRGYTSQTEPLQYLTPDGFRALSALVLALDQNQSGTEISSVDVDQNSDVHANFANGFTLLFALKDADKDVYQRFILALASQPFLNKTIADFDYLDLRFGDKLYYKEKSK